MITVTRKTTESEIEVKLSGGPVAPDYRAKIDTPLPFLSHMIEHIVWRSGINIETKVKLDKFELSHLVCEDLGITLGKAIYEYKQECIANGAYGFGDAIGIIDEARAFCAVSFEDRTYWDIDSSVEIPAATEGMQSEDLRTFLEGLATGANMTLHVDVQKGINGHHIWEAVYRALGFALGKALSPVESRKGMTAGVAGKIEFEIKKD